MFGIFKRKTKPSFVIKSSDYHTVSFIEKLLSDIAKWKLLAFFFAFFVVCCVFKNDITTIFSKYKSGYIAVLELDTAIVTDKHRSKVLRELTEDKNLKGVFLKINSPGGTITGSEILYREIKKLASKVPVYSLIYDLGASGAYMTAIASTKIFAHETSLTGSIGVLMQSLDIAELSKKIGARFKTYRSGKYKGQPDSFEQRSDEIEMYMQGAITESHKFFEDLVRKERNISITDIKNIANGKIFTGVEAVSLKLIDGVSVEDDVKEKLLKETGKLEFKDVSLKEEEKKSFVSQLIDEIMRDQNDKSSKVQVMAIMK